jgi:predicted transcriptional regulator of viral defense system
MPTKTEQALSLAKKMGLVRPKDLAGFGIAPVYLRRLVQTGKLVQSSRGVYKVPSHKPTAHHNLAEACKRVPTGVICLQSALYFHRLLKKRPAETWMAIDRKARKPSLEGLPVRFVRFSAEALKQDVEEHSIEGVAVKVTNCSKSVADAFRYRHKIGMTVAIDSLRACMRQERCAKAELLKCAAACRISTVLAPYVEALA